MARKRNKKQTEKSMIEQEDNQEQLDTPQEQTDLQGTSDTPKELDGEGGTAAGETPEGDGDDGAPWEEGSGEDTPNELDPEAGPETPVTPTPAPAEPKEEVVVVVGMFATQVNLVKEYTKLMGNNIIAQDENLATQQGLLFRAFKGILTNGTEEDNREATEALHQVLDIYKDNLTNCFHPSMRARNILMARGTTAPEKRALNYLTTLFAEAAVEDKLHSVINNMNLDVVVEAFGVKRELAKTRIKRMARKR